MPIIKETTYFNRWTRQSELKNRSVHKLDTERRTVLKRRFVVGNDDVGFIDHIRGRGLLREYQHSAVVVKDEINRNKLSKTNLGGRIETVFRWERGKSK